MFCKSLEKMCEEIIFFNKKGQSSVTRLIIYDSTQTCLLYLIARNSYKSRPYTKHDFRKQDKTFHYSAETGLSD